MVLYYVSATEMRYLYRKCEILLKMLIKGQIAEVLVKLCWIVENVFMKWQFQNNEMKFYIAGKIKGTILEWMIDSVKYANPRVIMDYETIGDLL